VVVVAGDDHFDVVALGREGLLGVVRGTRRVIRLASQSWSAFIRASAACW
jgi:hypothetical protein